LASQRRFDGPVLEDLLDRVRAEAGAGAQIVAANRVRKGGLGGFFAREYYEVIVDVPDEADDVVEVDEFMGAAPEIISVEAPAFIAPETPGGTRRVPASILDLAEAVNDDERDGRAGRRRPAIDLVDDDEVEIVGRAQAEGRSAQEHDEPTVVHTPIVPATGPSKFAEILESLAQVTDLPEAPAARRTPRGGIADEVRERMEQRAESARRTATAARATTDPIAIDDDTDLLIPSTALGAIADGAKPATFRRVPRGEAVLERPENALARLGLPARLVPRGVTMKDLRGALIQSLAELPAPPAVPDANGVVIAVVGTGSSAVLLARALCAEYGLDEERIVLATQEPLGEGIPAWLQVNDGSTAEERRRSWRRRTTPTIVAVSLPARRDALPWARDLLDRLEPTIAWTIVHAGWKSEDVRDWIERLGGVDTLALTHVDDTVSPAAILDLGIPVGRIAGRPATALEWAELLLGRMR
jgi:hypothetical protein